MFATTGEILYVFFSGALFTCFGAWFFWWVGDKKLISRDGVHMACLFLVPGVLSIVVVLPVVLGLMFGWS